MRKNNYICLLFTLVLSWAGPHQAAAYDIELTTATG